MSAQAAIEFIKQCSNKVAEGPGESQVTSVVSRSMNGLVAMIQNEVFDEDRNMRCQLETMQKLRTVAMKYDNNITSDPTRIFHYAMSECIEKVMEVFLAKKDVVVGVAAEEPVAQQNGVVGRDAVEEAVNEPLYHADNEAVDFDEPDMLFIKEEVDDIYEDGAMANQQLFDNASDRTDAMLDDTEDTRSPQLQMANRAVNGQAAPAAQFQQQVAAVPRIPNTPFPVQPHGNGPAIGMVTTPQQSSAASTPRGMSAVKTLVCRTCKKRNMNISSFIKHLSDIHDTTPVIERIAFECGCGHVATNYNGVRFHLNECDSRSLNVIDRAF